MVEVLISMVLIVVGLLGLMKVAMVATSTNQRSQRLGQATNKAASRIESLKAVPTPALTCLATGGAPAACETACVAGGGEVKACKLAMATEPAEGLDSTNTQYTYAFLVRQITTSLFDIHVMVTFTDDSVDPPRQSQTVLRTAVYR
jgi:Tfp pilus assembly protein PilV